MRTGAREAATTAVGPVWRMVRDGWSLLTTRERWVSVGIGVASLVSSVVELAALSMIVPFVGVLMGRDGMSVYPGAQRFVAQFDFGGQRDLFMWMGGAVVAGLSAAFVFRMVVNWFVETFSVRLTDRIIRETVRGCLEAPYIWLRAQNGQRLTQSINQDTMAVGQGIYPVVLDILYGAFMLVIGIVAIVATAPWQAMIVFGLLVGLGGAVLATLNPLSARVAARQRVHVIDSVRHLADAFTERKLIKASRAEHFFARRCEREYERANDTRRTLNMLNKGIPTGTLLLGQIGMLGLAVALVLSDLPAETVVAHLAFVLLVLSRVLPSVSALLGSMNKLIKSEPFFRAYLDLHAQIRGWSATVRDESDDLSCQPLEWTCVRLDGVGFSYPGADVPQVADVSLVLERGRSYGIAGPSGAGKSTLIDLVLGLLPPEKGEIRIDGRVLGSDTVPAWLSSIAYVPQEPHILDDSVRRNVAFGLPDAGIDDAAVWRALERAQLLDLVRSWPDGLDTRLGEGGSRLSGGQRQRVALARAMYRGASLLVLDEATNALDSVTEEAINRTVRDIPGITSLIVAHRVSTLRGCDAIILLEDGRLLEVASYQGMVDSNPVFRRLAAEDVVAGEANGAE